MKANIMKHDSQYINLRTGGMLSSRRDCVKGLVGLAGILATGQAPAAFVRSMLGARGMAFGGGKKGPSAKDYVQDGLIAMWDGIENAGWGTHDASATTWKDLIGSVDLDFTAEWGDDCAIFNGTNFAKTTNKYSLTWSEKNTVEAVFYMTNQSSGAGAFCAGGSDYNEEKKLSAMWSNYGNRVIMTAGRNKPVYKMITAPDQSIRKSYSLNYMTGGFYRGYENGTELTYNGNDYRTSFSCIYIGSDGSSRAKMIGDFCCLRVYEKELSIVERDNNYEVDKARFNLA